MLCGTWSISLSCIYTPHRPLWKARHVSIISGNMWTFICKLTTLNAFFMQLSELWAKTLYVTRDPQEIKKALKNSYFVIAFFFFFVWYQVNFFYWFQFSCMYLSISVLQFVAVLKPNEASSSSTGIYKKLIGMHYA